MAVDLVCGHKWRDPLAGIRRDRKADLAERSRDLTGELPDPADAKVLKCRPLGNVRAHVTGYRPCSIVDQAADGDSGVRFHSAEVLFSLVGLGTVGTADDIEILPHRGVSDRDREPRIAGQLDPCQQAAFIRETPQIRPVDSMVTPPDLPDRSRHKATL